MLINKRQQEQEEKRLESEERARREAEERTRKEAQEKAQREAEENAMSFLAFARQLEYQRYSFKIIQYALY